MPVSQEQRSTLCRLASETAKNAYAPYSNFSVGAALQTKSGDVFTGCNVENGSYGLTICAERTAMVAAVSAGHCDVVAVAISTPTAVSPCGACRQFLHEFAEPDCEILICNASGDLLRATTLSKLLPDSFDGPSD